MKTEAQQDYLFPIDPWKLAEPSLRDGYTALTESLLAQGNGYIGTRGTHEEGYAISGNSCEGTYLNGVYVKTPIHYEENAYGFATHNDKMLQVPNGKDIRIQAAGERFLPGDSKLTEYERYLDFETGILHRELVWKLNSGSYLRISSQRFVSLEQQHVLAVRYDVESLDFEGELILESCLDAAYGAGEYDPDDPRIGHLSVTEALQLASKEVTDSHAFFIHHVKGDAFSVCSAQTNQLIGHDVEVTRLEKESCIGQRCLMSIRPGEKATLYKFVAYHHGDKGEEETLQKAALLSLENAASIGWDALAAKQAEHMQQFWHSADIEIEGAPALQQGIRFSMLHLFQSAGRNGHSNIAAKGLTGPGYDGHYFWDTEIYMMPFFIHTQPAIARALMEYRYGLLDASRRRATQMGHRHGALYAWRTISGDECSAYFPAGTAQYHINAAIAFAIKRYVERTGDEAFLWEYGAEMLWETARIWMGIGHFNPRRDGQFTIHGVTGPDEYTAIVDNNFYTNAMAQEHLQYACAVAERMAQEHPKRYASVKQSLSLQDDELAMWQQAAEKMYLGYDDAIGINPQDDSFLDKPKWDFDNTPADKYPLLMHFHPLVIYRHQMLKQADVMLAMVLLQEKFSLAQLTRNLAFYEPITTFDSTLSSCIYSIANAWAGNIGRAYHFFEDSARMDIDNHHANTAYGIHTACMAGSWQCIVSGFGGMREQGDHLQFTPLLPEQWRSYQFNLRFQDRHLRVSVNSSEVVYRLVQGEPLTILHHDQAITLDANKPPVSCSLDQKECAA